MMTTLILASAMIISNLTPIDPLEVLDPLPPHHSFFFSDSSLIIVFV